MQKHFDLGVPLVNTAGNGKTRSDIDALHAIFEDKDTPVTNDGAMTRLGFRASYSQSGHPLTFFALGDYVQVYLRDGCSVFDVGTSYGKLVANSYNIATVLIRQRSCTSSGRTSRHGPWLWRIALGQGRSKQSPHASHQRLHPLRQV